MKSYQCKKQTTNRNSKHKHIYTHLEFNKIYSYEALLELGYEERLIKHLIKEGNLINSEEEGISRKELLKNIERITNTENYKELQILKDPDLLNIIDKELDKKIVGENSARKHIFIKANMINVANCKASSSNLMVNSESGIGKDHITNNTLKLFPSKRLFKRTRISPTAFTYWRPVDNWDGYIVYLEDISNMVLNSEVFKVMMSGGSHATIVINQKALDIEIKGKPIIILTIASANPNNENLRRLPICNLTSSKNQTKNILQKKLELAQNGIVEDYDPSILKAISLLKKVKVKVPFANKLFETFPSDHIIMRTSIDLFIDLIKSCASLYQYQRDMDLEGFILATWEDYDNATKIFNSQNVSELGIPLTKDQKKIIKIIKSISENYEEGWLSFPEIEEKISFICSSWLSKQLQKLVEYGILLRKNQKVESIKKPVAKWKLKEINKLELPSSETIKSCENQRNKKNEINKKNKINKINNIKSLISLKFPLNSTNENDDFRKNILELFKNKKEVTQKEIINNFGNESYKRVIQEGLLYEIRPGVVKLL